MKHAIAATVILLLSGASSAQEAYSAKSLFFGEDGKVVAASTTQKPTAETKPALASKQATKVKKTLATHQIGASYFIRLKQADGTTRDVLASRTFKSGDRFQLGVKVNRPSYVYVLNQDPDGQLSQIFPVAGQDNYVNAMGTVFLPSRGAFEFDAKPGAEHLLVFLSPTPLRGGVDELLGKAQPDLVADAGAAGGGSCASRLDLAGAPRVADAGTPAYAAKAITFKDEEACTAPAFASKAITFTDDPMPGEGGQVASYVVKKASNKTDSKLFLKIKLAHQ
jgi:hypothetical protein